MYQGKYREKIDKKSLILIEYIERLRRQRDGYGE